MKNKIFSKLVKSNYLIALAAISLASSLVLRVDKAQATILTFNSINRNDNAAVRQDWLNAIGIDEPEFLVDFETGFTDNQNISGTASLFPLGLTINDTSIAGEVIINSTGGINGSNPVGQFAATQNERAFLELDFSSNPVDYVGFQDIDHAGTDGIVTFADGTMTNISFETTRASGDSAEFFGIFRNDMPLISLIQLDARGDRRWGIDNIEYGTLSDDGNGNNEKIPEPSTILGLLTFGILSTVSKLKSKSRLKLSK